MSITPAIYARVRTEVIALFGWNADSLSPDQTLRLDCAVAARLALDDLQGKIMRGEAVDPAKMLPLSETLSRLLPPTALAAPPPADRVDPRETMWQTYRAMRDRGELFERAQEPTLRHRIAELEAEIAQLKGAGGTNVPPEPAPPEPASPMRTAGNVLSLSRASPKDAPPATPALSPPTAEERSAALARANAPVPQHVRDTRPQGEPWRDHMNSGAYDRWSNRS
jgi:hypothetical protein